MADLSILDEHRALKAEGRKGSGGGGPTPSDDARPVIEIVSGERVRAADEAEVALLGAGTDLYRQGGRIVRAVWDKIKIAGGGSGETLRISSVAEAAMLAAFEGAARFAKFDKRSSDWVTCDCPDKVAAEYLARDGAWRLPYLLGVVMAPTLRPDGSVLDKPGYDAATGLLYDPIGVEFPPIPEAPTREEAEAALALLKEPISKFSFADEASRSVALSGLITAVVRRALPTAPMHAFSAPAAGSGKSMLVDLAAILATGERAAVTTTGRGTEDGDAELEKRLTASMLEGDAVLSIDNVRGALGGELLCTLLTQPKAKLRRLGHSVNVEVPITTAFFATGNNLTIADDMTRRTLVATLDPGVECPELREFDFNPMAMVRERRPALVAAALVVVRAWLSSGENPDHSPLGSFEEWSNLVRAPLAWLGEVDPCSVMAATRRADPAVTRIRDLMTAWEAAFGVSATTIREVADRCQEKEKIKRIESGHDGVDREVEREGHGFADRELRDAVIAITGDRDPQPITPRKLSWWIRKNAGRYVDGKRFVESGEGWKYDRWILDGATPANAVEKAPESLLDDDEPF